MPDTPETGELFFFEQQKLELHPFSVEDWILDVGGGGEGVIGQLLGRSVVSIDSRASELEEALEASGDEGETLRIVMDARDLTFLDESFSDAALFFSLMYMQDDIQREALEEVYRVLKPGGAVRIWEFEFPTQGDRKEQVGVFPLVVTLPDRTIETGYSNRWPDAIHDQAWYRTELETTGFEVEDEQTIGKILILQGKKPSDAS